MATLLRAIAPLRGDRYGSAAEFLAALQAIGEVHRRPAEPVVPPAVPVATPAASNVNPFVAHLQSPLQPVTGQQRGHSGRGLLRHLRHDRA